MDTIADMVNKFFMKKDMKEQIMSEIFLSDIEKVVYLCGVLVLPITTFLTYDSTNAVLIYVCCNRFHLIVVVGVFFASFSRNNREFLSVRSTYFLLVPLLFSTISTVFLLNSPNKPATKSMAFLVKADSMGYVITGLLYFLFSLRWFAVTYIPRTAIYFCVKVKDRANERANNSAGRGDSYIPLLILIASYLSLVMFSLTRYFLFRTMLDWDDDALLYQNIPSIVSLLFLSFVSLRTVKFERLQGLVNFL
jgi:hypothetical protein